MSVGQPSLAANAGAGASFGGFSRLVPDWKPAPLPGHLRGHEHFQITENHNRPGLASTAPLVGGGPQGRMEGLVRGPTMRTRPHEVPPQNEAPPFHARPLRPPPPPRNGSRPPTGAPRKSVHPIMLISLNLENTHESSFPRRNSRRRRPDCGKTWIKAIMARPLILKLFDGSSCSIVSNSHDD